MKLYYAPGACSQAVHIVAREVGVAIDLELVDLKSHVIAASGEPFSTVNPKKSVPALVLDDGAVLTEAAALVQFVARLGRAEDLLGGTDELDRCRVVEWLNFLATELHKALGPLFGPLAAEERSQVVQKVERSIALVEARLATQPYLAGGKFTVADAYAFVLLNWLPMLGVRLRANSPIKPYLDYLLERAGVQEALRHEGFGQ